MLEYIDPANPFICAGILLIALIIILALFMKCENKITTIIQITIYFGIVSMFVLGMHNYSVKEVYKGDAEDENMEKVMRMAHGGDYSLNESIYDI